MAKRSYPYKAWTVLPSFALKEITLVRAYGELPGAEDWDVSDSCKAYHHTKVHASHAAAVAWAEQDLARQQAVLDKKQANLIKKRDNLAKEKAKA